MTENHKTYILDTNILLDSPEIVQSEKTLVFPIVLRELEELERRKGASQLQYQVRQAKRYLRSAESKAEILDEVSHYLLDDFIPSGYSSSYGDNILLAYALYYRENRQAEEELVLLTNDVLLAMKAESFLFKTENLHGGKPLTHTGVTDFYYNAKKEEDQELLAKIQTVEPTDYHYNPFDMAVNEYLVVWDSNEPTYKLDKRTGKKIPTGGFKDIGLYRYDGVNLKKIKFSNLYSSQLGKVKPWNVKQRLAFDLMQNDDIKVKSLWGRAGSGKDAIQLTHSLKALEEGKFERIVWIRNNVDLNGTRDIGALPDSKTEKLKPYAMMVADILGSEMAFDTLLNDGSIQIEHLGHLRGRTFNNSIIYVTETQNLSPEHVKVLLSKVGEDSILVMNGDTAQTDVDEYKSYSGIHALQDLVGEELYGQVGLDKIERSEVARLSEKIK